MISRNDACKISKAVKCAVSTFIDTARVRIMNKPTIEIWIQCVIYEVVDHPVTHGRFVNVSWLWVSHSKCRVGTVYVSFLYQVGV